MQIKQNGSFSIEIIENGDNIGELINIFNVSDKVKSASNILAPSLHKYWLMSFIKSYGADRNWAVMTVFKNGIPRLIMPIQKKDDGCLEFLCDETSDYNDFLFDDADIDIFQYGLEYWISRGISKIKLNRIPPDSITSQLLVHISRVKGWTISIDTCDTIPIIIAQPDRDIQEWIGVKSNHIKRYKRKLRALSRIAKISYAFIETKSQLVDEFPAIRKLHIARWETIGIHSKYSDQRRESFILSVCEEALQEQSLFFPMMKINDILASYIIGFRGGDTIFDWNTSFSVDYGKWSPGALLLLYVLSNPTIYGFNRYNLMKGTEKHKFNWTDKCETNLSVTISIP